MTAKRTRLNAIFGVDAATCLVAGLVLALGASALEPLTGLPVALSRVAGAMLFAVAALFAAMAAMRPIPRWLTLFGVFGNLAWVAASLAVVMIAPLNGLGVAFVAAQALVVAVLAWLEWTNSRPTAHAAA